MENKPPFPFILIPVLDILLLIFSAFTAVANRGTIWGWLATAFVLWQTWNLVKFVREHP